MHLRAVAAVAAIASGTAGGRINAAPTVTTAGARPESTTLTVQVHYKRDGALPPASMHLRGSCSAMPFLDQWNAPVALAPILGSHETLWSVKLEYNPSDQGSVLQFKVLLGGTTWQVGANEETTLPSGDAVVDVYPYFEPAVGTVVPYANVFSKELGNTRDLAFYLPPLLLENTLASATHLLVMHDGNNVFNLTCGSCCPNGCWETQSALDGLIAGGKMDPAVVVVGVFNTPSRIEEYTYVKDPTYGGGKADLYLDFIESTVVPLARAKLPMLPNASVGTLGSSLGGLLSCYAGWTRPSTYSRAGCMSSSFWWDSENFNANVLDNGTATPVSSASFYLDSGDTGSGADDQAETIRVRGSLEREGKQLGEDLFYYLDHGGAHNEQSWGARVWRPLSALYPIEPLAPRPTLPRGEKPQIV